VRAAAQWGIALALAVAAVPGAAHCQSVEDWPLHSRERPRPPIVTPGGTPQPVAPPSDARVLFDGRDLSAWRSKDGGPAGWRVVDGYFEAVPGAGEIRTAEGFGDVQLHIEWATPTPPTGGGQGRGNSGVFLMGEYELQVLDSYENTTYADGQAGAIYGQYPPLVNASRRPGEWQSYDIVFRRPRFDARGRLLQPARLTVLHNGILIQDGATLTGPTASRSRPPYAAHADRLPFSLQDHSNPVRFRNVWVRDLEGAREPSGRRP
jgi:hypothetical protein